MLRHENIDTLITQMRQEASEVRSCFRTLATQSMLFAATSTAAMLGVRHAAPDVVLAAPVVMWVIMVVQRIGIHKWTTSNRLLGYELHLERLDGDSYRRISKVIGWEEAFRAWRIVQAGIFQAIYQTPTGWKKRPFIADFWWRFYRPNREHVDGAPISECWWLQSRRVEAKDIGARYHAGSYLYRMFGILEALQMVSLLPLFVTTYSAWADRSDRSSFGYLIDQLATNHSTIGESVSFLSVVSAASIVLYVLNHLAVARRRRIVEDELLSIHSCAIVWKAVVLAHVCAWGNDINERREYTERLARISRWMAAFPREIRKVIDCRELSSRFATTVPSCKCQCKEADRMLFLNNAYEKAVSRRKRRK